MLDEFYSDEFLEPIHYMMFRNFRWYRKLVGGHWIDRPRYSHAIGSGEYHNWIRIK